MSTSKERNLPIGTVRVRVRYKRSGEARAWVKVGAPNSWKLRAAVVWESANGPLQPGMVVHHVDGDKLNDIIDNLRMLTKAQHLAEHRCDYIERAIAGLIKSRRERRWSTRSSTKRTGAPPVYEESSFHAAESAIAAGMSPHAASGKFSVSRTTCYRIKKRLNVKNGCCA